MRVVAAVGLLILGATASGCSNGEGAGAVLPSLSPSAAPTNSGVPSAPPSISAATPQGAVAFARYFYGQIEQAFVAEDPSLVSRLSAPECKVCRTYVSSISTLRDKHQRLAGRLVFTISLAEAPAITGDTARVDVIWSTPALKRYDDKGVLILDQKALSNYEETVQLKRSGDSWLVTELQS